MHSCISKNLFRTQEILSESFNYNNRIVTYLRLKQTKHFSNNPKKKCDNENYMDKNDRPNLASAINSKYKIFRDKDADIILDVSEEQQKITLEDLNMQKLHDPYADINLSRGSTGVFDIEELVTLLQRDKAKDIFVASVPKEYTYVDYIVIITGKSHKHMSALATFIRKVYKLKRHQTDLIPKIEGEKSKDWMALDLGNIALHIFSASARAVYNLETLWTVGLQYDDTSVSQELNIMDQYNTFLNDLQPADIQ